MIIQGILILSRSTACEFWASSGTMNWFRHRDTVLVALFVVVVNWSDSGAYGLFTCWGRNNDRFEVLIGGRLKVETLVRLFVPGSNCKCT